MSFRNLICSCFIWVAASNGLQAQVPANAKVQYDSITINVSNIQILTAPQMVQNASGSIPESPSPLDSSKLLPPNTSFFISFDYSTDFSPSDAPDALKSLYVGVVLNDEDGKGFRGYGPATIDKPSGTAQVWLSNVYADESKNVDVETRLSFYGIRNDNSRPPSVSTDKIKFTARMDRLAAISETQFDAIKGMYKRLIELESRVKELEAQNSK